MKLSAVIECSLLASVWMVASVSGDSIRTVALSGQPAAGIGGDLVYDSLDDLPIINNVGQTAFAARLSGGSVNEGNNHGIWLEGGGAGLELVAREGEHAPGLPSGASLAGTLNDEGFLVLNLNDAGQTAFTGRLNDPGVTSINDGGIWSGGGEEGLRLVVRSGFPVPGVTGSDDVYAFLSPTLNSSGKTAFAWIDSVFLAYRGPSSIGSESEGGGVTLLASAGDPAPGTGGGFEFSYFRGPISFNDLGQTAFRGHLDGPVIRSHNDLGIWSEGGGAGLELVARTGTPAPGVPLGTGVFRSLGAPVLNNAGHISFGASLATGESGIWSERGGSGLQLVALSGLPATGTPGGANFSEVKNPVFNDAGETAFLGRVDGVVASPTGQGIWSEGGGDGLALVALSGDPAPDTPDGGDFYYFRDPTINNAGRTAFTGYVSWGLRHGIWAEDRYGGLTLIALTGELLDVDDGPGTDFRTISKLNFHRKVPEFIWSPVDPTPQSGFQRSRASRILRRVHRWLQRNLRLESRRCS